MAKATTIKDALKKLEETRGIIAAEAEKVQRSGGLWDCVGRSALWSLIKGACYDPNTQIELNGQCPPIEKMDAALSTLKACKWVRAAAATAHALVPHPGSCMGTAAPGTLAAGCSLHHCRTHAVPRRPACRARNAVQARSCCTPLHGTLIWRCCLLHACRHLALSTNNIEKISSLAGMDSLKILSLGRNLIKKASSKQGACPAAQRLRRTAGSQRCHALARAVAG